ncbi:uncharacterized protein TNCV_4508781 [Trichonephila clavipes]|nr:uncharacterized protein TNCV_4508781 [Trichonephila clavipes]
MSLYNIALQVFNDRDVLHFKNTHSIHSCIWSSEEIESLLGKEPATLLKHSQVREILRGKIPTPYIYKYPFPRQGKDHSISNKKFEILVDKKLSTLPLPYTLKKVVTDLVRLAFIEHYKWLEDHDTIINCYRKFLGSTSNIASSNRHFHWTQDNKIDRYKTAKAIIADDKIIIRDRFMLASYYCFQEDVLLIWEKMNDVEKNFFSKYRYYFADMWANWARNRVELDWDEIAQNSRVGLQTYFPKLKQEKRLQYLMRCRGGMWNDHHELQFCLSTLDQNEQDEILTKRPLQILEVFLDWSVQAKLLDVVELLWPYLSERDFSDFLYLILSRKRMLKGIGYDYVTLVKKLWKRLSFGQNTFIKNDPNDPIYYTLSSVLEYDGSRLCPHELCVRSNDNIFVALQTGSTVFVICKYKRVIESFNVKYKLDFMRFMLCLCSITRDYSRIRMMFFIQG